VIFLLNLEDKTAHTRVKPLWQISHAIDLLADHELTLIDGAFDVTLPFGQVAVIYCSN